MTIKEMLSGLTYICDDANILNAEIDKIVFNSKDACPGSVFVCMSGAKDDGNKYIEEAKSAGAIIVSDKNISSEKFVKVENARIALSRMSSNFYGNPEKNLKFIGVTGTNGKTTTVNMISEILKFNDKKVGIIGTMGAHYNGKVVDTGFTTPDPTILFKILDDMESVGVEYVVMEVSAHAIALNKIEGINFDVGVLTNITQDHLDFFKSMDAYAVTKMKFLSPKYCKSIVVNADDKYGLAVSEATNIPCISYGLTNPSDVFAIDVMSTINGSNFICNYMDSVANLGIALAGKFNVSNALAAISACGACGLTLEQMTVPLRYMHPVEGRFNVVNMNNFNIVVDYAHTPDGLEKILSSIKEISEGKLYVVFGCGGNRDKDKRPKMGKIAEKYADHVFVTSDNPRFEKPEDIMADIERGMALKNHSLVADREEAIIKGIVKCKAGDTLLIAGKGAESYQEIMGEKKHFNDLDVINKYFKNLITPKKEFVYE